MSPDIVVASTSLRSETLGGQPHDFVELKEGLDGAGLPSGDVVMTGRLFWRFRDSSGRTVAYGGLEPHGTDALLRSIMTLPEARGQGFGGQVATFLIGYARLRGMRRLWLLTTTASEFFRKLGFVETDRAKAPDVVRATTAFAALCPASAVCMSRTVSP